MKGTLFLFIKKRLLSQGFNLYGMTRNTKKKSEFKTDKKYLKKLLKFQRICVRIAMFRFGALAQLGERYTGSVEVSGSIPLCSTKQISDEHFVFQRLFCNKG